MSTVEVLAAFTDKGSQSVADVAAQTGVTTEGVLKWLKRGVMTPRGRVKLAGVRRGGRWLVTDAALAEFIQATNGQGTEAVA